MSKNFKFNLGVDVSEVQLKKCQENLNNIQAINNNNDNKQPNCKLICNDFYKLFENIEIDKSIKFDLITIGQAFHWFENTKFIEFA